MVVPFGWWYILTKKWWFVIQTIKIILVALFKWIRSTYFKSQFQNVKNDGPGLPGLPPENSHDNGKSPFLIRDASSNGCFSSVMLVFQVLFWGITRTHPKPRSDRTGGNASMRWFVDLQRGRQDSCKTFKNSCLIHHEFQVFISGGILNQK